VEEGKGNLILSGKKKRSVENAAMKGVDSDFTCDMFKFKSKQSEAG